MNWVGILSFLLSVASTISSIFMISAIRYWLKTSGFTYLDRSIEILNYFSVIISLIISLTTFFIIKQCNNMISFFISYAIGLFGLLEFYYGLFLWTDSKGYISTMIDIWEKSLNKSFLHEIENKFTCCSFHKFRQFYNDPCNISITPCLYAISNTIAEPTEAIGITIIFQAAVHGMISLFLGFAAQKKKKKNTTISLPTPWTKHKDEEAENFLTHE